MSFTIQTEQEAAVTILFTCVMQDQKQLTDQQIEQISRAMVLCTRFRGGDLNELTRNAISLQAKNDSREILEACAPLIDESFRETLFAMVCEVMLLDGQINEDRTRVIALLALNLNITMERMKMMLATYLIRNKWNVQVVETNDQLNGNGKP
jgi:hypothetical protein